MAQREGSKLSSPATTVVRCRDGCRIPTRSRGRPTTARGRAFWSDVDRRHALNAAGLFSIGHQASLGLGTAGRVGRSNPRLLRRQERDTSRRRSSQQRPPCSVRAGHERKRVVLRRRHEGVGQPRKRDEHRGLLAGGRERCAARRHHGGTPARRRSLPAGVRGWCRPRYGSGAWAPQKRVRGVRAFDDLLLTKEWSPLEKGVTEHTDYARDVGFILVDVVKGGDEHSRARQHQAGVTTKTSLRYRPALSRRLGGIVSKPTVHAIIVIELFFLAFPPSPPAFGR